MSIDIANESGSDCDEESLVRQAQFVLDRLRIHPDAELSLVLVDEAAMASLHERWMDEEGPTDVLSFPMDELRPAHDNETPEPGLLGDVVICPSVAARQAAAAGHSERDELGILLTHGILHLLGYDHEVAADERLMFGLQAQLVGEWRQREPDEREPDGQESDQPESDQSQSDRPESDQPESEQPESDQPDTDQPDSDQQSDPRQSDQVEPRQRVPEEST